MSWVNSRYIFKIEQLEPAVGLLLGRMNGDTLVFDLSHWEGSAIFNEVGRLISLQTHQIKEEKIKSFVLDRISSSYLLDI